MTKNVFKYVCFDCKAESWWPKHAFSRASRPRCLACGSAFLDPATKEARDRFTLGQNAANDQREMQDRKMGK